MQSTLEPSASPRPLVIRGTPVTPPLPVLVVAPQLAASRLTHASRVKALAPSDDSPADAPIVTWSLLPSKFSDDAFPLQLSAVHTLLSLQSGFVAQIVGSTLLQLPPEHVSAVAELPSLHWPLVVQQPGTGE